MSDLKNQLMSDEVKKQLEQAYEHIQQQASIINDPRVYVQHWLTTNMLQIMGNGTIKHRETRKTESSKDILDTMWLDYQRQVTRQYFANKKLTKKHPEIIEIKEMREADMKKALSETIKIQMKVARAATSALLQYSGADLSLLQQTVLTADGRADKANVHVLAHWMWCVKRKNLGLPVVDHIMPVFFGAQGAGKSTFVTMLFAPLKDYAVQIPLSELGEEKYNFSLANNLIVFFDEMRDAERTDVNKLKLQVTTSFNSTRIYHTQEVVNTEQGCMFIGASNKHLNELIFDTTGMRRFFQIDCLDKMDWDTLATIDFTALWQSIDENKDKGYFSDAREEIVLKQRELVALDDLELFAQDMGIDLSLECQEYAADDVFFAFKTWAAKNGVKNYGASNFSRKFLNRIKCTKLRKMEGSSKITYYKLNKSCLVRRDVDQARLVSADFGKGG